MSTDAAVASDKCIRCCVYLRKTTGFKKKIDSPEEAIQVSQILDKTVEVGHVLCNNCRIIVSKILTRPVPQDESSDASNIFSQPSTASSSSHAVESDSSFSCEATLTSTAEVECVELPFPRLASTEKLCCICGSDDNRCRISFEARSQVFKKRKIFIPDGNRCCQKHLFNKDRFLYEDIENLRVHSHSITITVDELTNLLGKLAIDADSSILDKIGDFSCSEHQMNVFTGLSWDNIIKLRDMMTSMRNSQTRNVTQALTVFLFKLRTGSSNAVTASVLGLDHEQIVSEYCNSVIQSFEKDVLPTRFGIHAITRETIAENSSNMVKNLFQLSDDKLMLICDGTYIRHQKSSNNDYQRKSFSGQKKVPLCKPFTICTTNGYIVDMMGPFEANINDAQILGTILKDENGLITLLHGNDIFVLDRGFRDVLEELNELGFEVLMPALKGKRNQLTTKESNESRFVTKIRWVVESVHGILKQKYKLLDRKFDNKMLPKTKSYVRIASFLQNEFGKRLDSDAELSSEIVIQMNSTRNTENTLMPEVVLKKWHTATKTPFQTITSEDLEDFPELTMNDLKIFFTGTYQLKQAISYLAEMIDDDESLNLQFVKESENILKFYVRSRHRKSKTYKCFIEYRSNINSIAGIVRYCCDCANGLRTVGSCSHIAAIVYYLSYGRYMAKLIKPAQILSQLFSKDNLIPVIEENSDDD